MGGGVSARPRRVRRGCTGMRTGGGRDVGGVVCANDVLLKGQVAGQNVADLLHPSEAEVHHRQVGRPLLARLQQLWRVAGGEHAIRA